MEDSELYGDGTIAPLVVGAGLDRWGNTVCLSGDQVWTKVSRKDTGDAWSLFESFVPAGLAVPLHSHREQDEWFWILDGEFIFEVAGETHRLTAGMSLLAPRRKPHRWKKTADANGRLLILAQPADRLEDFFGRFAALPSEQLNDLLLLQKVFDEGGMDLLGPPMGDESM